MALSKQLHIYSVDTSAFYTDDEKIIHKQMNAIYINRTKLKKELENKKTHQDRKEIIEKQILTINKGLSERKKKLKGLITKNINSTRHLDNSSLTDRNVVSVFDSVLTRTLGMQTEIINNEILIVQTYYFGVTESLIKNGFIHTDKETGEVERYIVYTASAGQIRTKKTIFIKESAWNTHKNTLLCGLTVEKINAKDGVNTNKYLAYLALNNSATDEWKEFDIKKAIVVPDMVTTIKDTFDYIDYNTFDIERKELEIEAEQTDGCGIMLSSKFKKPHMVRSPFIKGLLVPFPFDKFIEENCSDGKIKDIYNKEWNIIEDEIEVIFTKSQFKMYKYYDNWKQYVDYYTDFKCQTGICNIEEDHIRGAKLNYQILQTLTDFKEEEIKKLSKFTISDINSVGSNRETMLKILGVVPENENKNSFQKAIELYPEILQEPYAKEVLKQTRQSLIKDAKSGKIKTQGKYTFVIPDLYAFCEWLFLGDKNPKGLLKRGEVSCQFYKNGIELDCMRSPHLYREHAIRKNTITEETKKWFVTKGVYVSIDDSISKLLMNDWDGDKYLVSCDQTLIEIAKRNMKDIVPLYYEMHKAEIKPLNSDQIYIGLHAAYTGGNIGVISNDISKIWNSGDVSRQALDSVKILTAYNNFVIDYAKTLYKPTIPPAKYKIIKQYTKNKLPHFFIHAKDKLPSQVEPVKPKPKNDDTFKDNIMGVLENVIPSKKLNFTVQNLGKFDYKVLMKNPREKINQDVIDVYDEVSRNLRLFANNRYSDKNNTLYIASNIVKRLLDVEPNIYVLTDVLVKYLYKKNTTRKVTLWECFGDIIIENIKRNLVREYGDKSKQCAVCGERISITRDSRVYCDKCQKEKQKESDNFYRRRKRLEKTSIDNKS